MRIEKQWIDSPRLRAGSEQYPGRSPTSPDDDWLRLAAGGLFVL